MSPPRERRKRLFLHIGTHKTGSTSIQWALTTSRSQLGERRICYPRTGCPEWAEFGQHLLAWSVIDRQNHLPPAELGLEVFDEDRRAALWTELRREIDQADADTVVISSEEFDVLTTEQIALVGKELRDYDVTPVVFIRRLSDLIESAYRTTVTHDPFWMSIREFVIDQRTRLDYAAMMEDWSRLSAGGEIIVFAYDDPSIRENAVGAFFELLKVPLSDLRAKSKISQNESVPAFVCELARYLRQKEVDETEVQRWLGDMRRVRFAPAANRSYALMSHDVRADLDARFRGEVELIKADVATFHVRGDLNLGATVGEVSTVGTPVEAILALGRELAASRNLHSAARPDQRFRNMSETEWRDLWLRQANHHDVSILPSVAPIEWQELLDGGAGAAPMERALDFRRLVLDRTPMLPASARLLDFGCGWGRRLRVFLKDFAASNMIGADTNAESLRLCRELLPEMEVVLRNEAPPLQVRSNSIDLIVAHSAFSAMAEEAVRAWLNELMRIVKPSGAVAITAWGARLFEVFERIRANGGPANVWEAKVARAFPDFDEAEQRYRDGCFVFGRGEEGHGMSLMPKAWIEHNVAGRVEGTEDLAAAHQAMFVLRHQS